MRFIERKYQTFTQKNPSFLFLFLLYPKELKMRVGDMQVRSLNIDELCVWGERVSQQAGNLKGNGYKRYFLKK